MQSSGLQSGKWRKKLDAQTVDCRTVPFCGAFSPSISRRFETFYLQTVLKVLEVSSEFHSSLEATYHAVSASAVR